MEFISCQISQCHIVLTATSQKHHWCPLNPKWPDDYHVSHINPSNPLHNAISLITIGHPSYLWLVQIVTGPGVFPPLSTSPIISPDTCLNYLFHFKNYLFHFKFMHCKISTRLLFQTQHRFQKLPMLTIRQIKSPSLPSVGQPWTPTHPPDPAQPGGGRLRLGAVTPALST